MNGQHDLRCIKLKIAVVFILSLLFLLLPNIALGMEHGQLECSLTQTQKDVEIAKPSTRALANPVNLPEVTNENVLYAIICPTNLRESVTELADWKTRKGVPTKIYTTDGPDGIYVNYPDGDNASKIHDFLTDLHNNSNLQWLLLVGDEDIIPSRSVFVNAAEQYGLDDYYYSDHYYAGLNNSWDQDSDGIYGEQKGDIGWQADLYVGRLPVNNVSEADLAVNKIIKYETSPELGSWMRNATFWSGLLDGPNNSSAYQSYKDNALKVTDKIIQNVPDNMVINYLYDYNELEGGNYSFQNDTLNHKSGKASFNAGHAIINFAGQALYTGDELAHYDNETGQAAVPNGFGPLFSYNDGKYSTNGNKLPFLYLSTCSVNFSEPDDSNLEQLITATNGGVIGLIGNSGKTYRGETENGSSYGNWWLNEQFWNMFFNNTFQPGKCLYTLKESYVLDVIRQGVPYIQMAVANLVGYNLLGDPELSIWTDIPNELKFNYSLVYNTAFKLRVEINDRSGEPVEHARVCVYNSGVYEYATTNASGMAIMDIDPRTLGSLEVTITAHNYLPYISNFTYENKAPVLKLEDVTLDEDEVDLMIISINHYLEDIDNTTNNLTISILESTYPGAGVMIDNYKRITISPQNNWFGQARITIQAYDGIHYVVGSFSITVNPVNDPPVITNDIENKKLKMKVGETFKLQIKAIDIENDTLIFSDNSKLFDIDMETGSIRVILQDKHAGKHNITITVSDGLDSTTLRFELEVVECPSFMDIYWFPITVIVVTILCIVMIKVYAITHTEKVSKEKRQPESKNKRKDNLK